MKKFILSAGFTKFVRYCLDNLLPPIIRDSKLFMTIPLKVGLGNRVDFFNNFRQKGYISSIEFNDHYNRFIGYDRKIDITVHGVDFIKKNIVGQSVLDVGCGNGFLAKILSEGGANITGIDISLNKNLKNVKNRNLHYIEGDAESLPFDDCEFDTVVSAAVLEHVLNPTKMIQEMRRVCKKRLILVVPREREYRYGFNNHIRFFPYIYSLQRLMNNDGDYSKTTMGEHFYYEDKKKNES